MHHLIIHFYFRVIRPRHPIFHAVSIYTSVHLHCSSNRAAVAAAAAAAQHHWCAAAVVVAEAFAKFAASARVSCAFHMPERKWRNDKTVSGFFVCLPLRSPSPSCSTQMPTPNHIILRNLHINLITIGYARSSVLSRSWLCASLPQPCLVARSLQFLA